MNEPNPHSDGKERPRGQEGLDSDSALDQSTEEALTAMLRAERNGMEEALAGGPPATAEERAFVEETRAFVRAQFARDTALAEGAPPTGVTAARGPRLLGRTALLPAPPEPAPHRMGPQPGPAREPARTWKITPLARTAAAALLLAGIGWFAWSRSGERGTGNQGLTPSAAPDGGPRYLGDGNGPSPGSRSLPPFPNPVDWSSAAPPGMPFYQVVIKDRGPRRVDEHGVLFSTEDPLFETTWTCPPPILETLPESVDVEVYVEGQAPGSPALWVRSYSVPPPRKGPRR